jgi:hypothetical protein
MNKKLDVRNNLQEGIISHCALFNARRQQKQFRNGANGGLPPKSLRKSSTAARSGAKIF